MAAIEQARIEMLFKLLDLKGYCRLCHEQHFGGLGEGEMSRHGVEHSQPAVGHVFSGFQFLGVILVTAIAGLVIGRHAAQDALMEQIGVVAGDNGAVWVVAHRASALACASFTCVPFGMPGVYDGAKPASAATPRTCARASRSSGTSYRFS